MKKYTKQDAFLQRSEDELRTLLRKSIDCLSEDTFAQWIGDQIDAINNPGTDPADRLEANAMLVGIISIISQENSS